MGSTSFHLLVADVCSCGALTPVLRRRVHLQLGRWIAGGQKIPGRVWDEVEACAVALVNLAEDSAVKRLLPVGTAAFRETPQILKLVRRLERATKLDVRVLSGIEEACLLFAALRERHGGFAEPALTLDLGGGSLEVARGDERGVAAAWSLPLGVVHLHSHFRVGESLSREAQSALRRRVRESLEPVGVRGLASTVSGVFASGGSLRALARLLAAQSGGDRCARGGGPYSFARFEALCEALSGSSAEERRRMPGISPRRVNTLPTAAVIVSEVGRILDLRQMTVSDWGLREGVLMEAARKTS